MPRRIVRRIDIRSLHERTLARRASHGHAVTGLHRENEARYSLWQEAARPARASLPDAAALHEADAFHDMTTGRRKGGSNLVRLRAGGLSAAIGNGLDKLSLSSDGNLHNDACWHEMHDSEDCDVFL